MYFWQLIKLERFFTKLNLKEHWHNAPGIYIATLICGCKA